MLSMSLASIKEMIPNSVDGYSRERSNCSLLLLLLLDAHRLIRSLKRTAKQFVSIKKRDSLHKLHQEQPRHSYMHRRAWRGKYATIVFDIFRALSPRAQREKPELGEAGKIFQKGE